MSRIVLAVVLLGVIGSFFYFDLGQYVSLDHLKSEQAALDARVAAQPLAAAATYFVLYVLVAALSLPGAALITLIGGAIFGLGWGLLLASFASSIGATLAMMVSRFLLRDMVKGRFAEPLARIDRGMEREGAYYLFTLRLVPAFPFFAINLAMGLTRISIPVFFVVSQIGMLAGTAMFVNAGTHLAQIESLAGILSPGLIASLVLLGIFPLLAKRILDALKRRRVYKPYKKPGSFDMDVVVIGAGAGGLVAALIVATLKGKVALIEKHKMGGDCLHTGCVPSKSLIRSARLVSEMQRGMEFGLSSVTAEFDFHDVMERVQSIIKTIEPHDSVERFTSLGVICEMGEGKILSPFEVQVNDRIITTRTIILATGARPFIPPIAGLEQVNYLTSDTLWEQRVLPKRLIILGGGPIGTELTQAYARLGSTVTQIEALPSLINREDPEVSAFIKTKLESEGVRVLTNTLAVGVEVSGHEKWLVVESGGRQAKIAFDEMIIAVGRQASVSGFGLEELGVEIAPQGTVAVDAYLRTNFPNIYAIGDVAGPYQFTHTASHMAWFAAVNALFGGFKSFAVDYRIIPWATFTSPEVARCGVNETEAAAKGIDFEVTRYDISGLDRALADQEASGFIKVITAKGKDRILGVTILADHAGELISEYVLAMKHGLGLNKILGTIHIYPTLAEMNKFAASEWKKAHKPDWALDLTEKLFNWRRG